MKQKTVSEIKREIREFVEDNQESYGFVNQVSKHTKVTQSQVSRILNGDFKQLSKNVRRICKYANIKLYRPGPVDSKDLSQPLVDALSSAWDGSDDSERLLIEIINGVGRSYRSI